MKIKYINAQEEYEVKGQEGGGGLRDTVRFV